MATENASYISELNTAYPADGDPVGEGGGTTTGTGSTRGHLNMIKYALKTQFSGLSGTTAITASEAEMNLLDGGYEGTAVVSTGESGATKFLREDGDGTCSWQVPADTNTTYTAGDGLDLSGTEFSTDLKANGGLKIVSTELALDPVPSNTWGDGTEGAQRGFALAITDGTIDLNLSNNFKYTPGAADNLEFSNETSGQAGFIWLDNSSGYTISPQSEVKKSSTFATDISTAGKYLISYFCDGTDVWVSASAALS